MTNSEDYHSLCLHNTWDYAVRAVYALPCSSSSNATVSNKTVVTNSSGSTRLANGTYYMSFNGANSDGVYTCSGPGNETLKLKVTVSNDGVKHEDASGG